MDFTRLTFMISHFEQTESVFRTFRLSFTFDFLRRCHVFIWFCFASVPFPAFDSRIRSGRRALGPFSLRSPLSAGRPAACSSCWRRRIHSRGSSAARRRPEWSLWLCTSPSCCAEGRSPSHCGGTTRGGAGGSHSLAGPEGGSGCRSAWRRRLLQLVFLP